MNKYTEAIQRDDVVILCDGIPMGVGEILAALNAATPPADAALADDALCESLIEASDMRWNGDVYVGDGADLMNLVRAALRARAVPEGWISVDDRKPDHLQDVIFVVRDNKDSMYNGRVLGGRFVSSGGGEWSEFGVPGISFFASYWMPAPQPPALLAASKGGAV